MHALIDMSHGVYWADDTWSLLATAAAAAADTAASQSVAETAVNEAHSQQRHH